MSILQSRRGTDAQRLTITPQSGEFIWTTDTKILYLGDGSTVGGIPVAGATGLPNSPDAAGDYVLRDTGTSTSWVLRVRETPNPANSSGTNQLIAVNNAKDGYQFVNQPSASGVGIQTANSQDDIDNSAQNGTIVFINTDGLLNPAFERLKITAGSPGNQSSLFVIDSIDEINSTVTFKVGLGNWNFISAQAINSFLPAITVTTELFLSDGIPSTPGNTNTQFAFLFEALPTTTISTTGGTPFNAFVAQIKTTGTGGITVNSTNFPIGRELVAFSSTTILTQNKWYGYDGNGFKLFSSAT